MAIKSFSDIVLDIRTALTANGSRYTDFLAGSRIYAFVQGVASALAQGWIGLAEVKQIFFVSTATGTDLDRRINDVGMTRNQGSKATGAVIGFLTGSDSVPAGTLLRTLDQRTTVEVAQTTALTGPNTAIPVIAIEVGSMHNLSAGTILTEVDGRFANVTFRVGSTGLDVFGNPTGSLTGGSNRETDEQVRSRFPDYITSLSRSTLRAVTQALKGIPGVSSLVVENHTPVPGYIRISLSDGSDTISNSLKAAVATVMEEWAAAGIGYVLRTIGRTEVVVEVKVYTTDLSVSPATIQALVAAELNALDAELELGQSLYRSEIIKRGFIDGFENFEVIRPVSDVLAEPGELIGIDSIIVNVVYV